MPLILASNFKNNIDEAFLRRFHSLVPFPMPNFNERLMLWQKSMPANLKIDTSVNLDELAKPYELSGASKLNAVQHAVLQSYSRDNHVLLQGDLIDGIKKEYLKEDKTF